MRAVTKAIRSKTGTAILLMFVSGSAVDAPQYEGFG
jgi:hypothetical protein